MELDQARTIITQARSDLTTATINLNTLQGQVNGYKKLIEGLEALYPELAPSIWAVETTVSEPRAADTSAPVKVPATELVRRVLDAQPDRWWVLKDVVQELEAQGHAATPTAIRLGLSAAADSGFAQTRPYGARSSAYRRNKEVTS